MNLSLAAALCVCWSFMVRKFRSCWNNPPCLLKILKTTSTSTFNALGKHNVNRTKIRNNFTFPISFSKWIPVFSDTSTGNAFIFPVIMKIQFRDLFFSKALHVGWQWNAMLCKLLHFYYERLGCWVTVQRAKKVVSDSPGLVDFAIRLVNSVINLPDGQVMFFEQFEY